MENVRFPPGCEVVGVVHVSSEDGIDVDRCYVREVHPELHFYGPLKYQEVSSGIETVVTITQGLPPEVFLG